ncbi:hypothetical protein [Demequina litorisediminis]|uniref:Integral membrane protein n=1 Tax=Demequina litorisediminis TaxID=1849022 RepID=A0ABQ6IHD4_9MICO|nr:hypothetical protein [Demequina litorisediminis]GMA36816.1 hypothetical protein GCM10025876_30200 [Demequina litorisediminis]
MTDPASSPSEPSAATSALASVLCGVVAAGIGLLPWWVEGITLPLQNIWATETMPGAMPLALLPFSQYYVTTIAAMLVMGGAVAGAAQRWLLDRWGAGRRNLVTTGLAATQVVCVAQAAVVTGGGLEDSSRASVYLAGLVLAALVSVATSVLVQRGLAGRGPAAVMLGATAGALALGMWISALVAATWGIAGTPPSWLYGLATWLPSVIVGVALGVCGVATVRRAVGAATSLLALWALPALATALSYAVGSRIYLQNPAELVPAGLQVLGMALGPNGGAPQRVLIAVAVGVTTWAVRRTLARRAGH